MRICERVKSDLLGLLSEEGICHVAQYIDGVYLIGVVMNMNMATVSILTVDSL